jgi:hypothetical protein
MIITCNKLLQNVKMKWINMLSYTKRVYVNRSLVVKMHVDITKSSFAFENLVLLCELDFIGKKISIMPWNVVNGNLKCSMQSWWMGLSPYYAWFTHVALANKFFKIHHSTRLWVVISNNTKLNLVTNSSTQVENISFWGSFSILKSFYTRKHKGEGSIEIKFGLHITTLCKPCPSPLIDVCDLLSRCKEENVQDQILLALPTKAKGYCV